MIKKRTTLAIFGIILLGLGLRAYRCGYQSLWIDEVLTSICSTGSLSEITFNSLNITNILPLYYFVVSNTLKIGNGEIYLRLPSLIFGVLSILLIYFVVRNLITKNIAVIVSLLLAISPFHIWYSQDARPYSMLIFLSLLSLLLLQESIKRKKSLLLKFGFVFSTVSAFYCHLVAIPFIGFLALFVMFNIPREEWKKWIPVFLCIFLLTLPGFYLITLKKSNVTDYAIQVFNPLYIVYVLWTFVAGYSLGPTIADLHSPERLSIVLSHVYIILPIMTITSVLILLGAVRLWKQSRLNFWIATIFFFLPLSFTTLGAIYSDFSFNVRYTILSFLPFTIFLAIGLSFYILIVTGTQSLSSKWMRIFTVSFLILISSLSLNNYYFNELYQKENNRMAAQFLKKHSFERDLVICNAPYTYLVLKYYLDGKKDLNLIGYPVNTPNVDPNLLSSEIVKILSTRKRVWLFLSRTYHSDPNGYIMKYFEKKYRRELRLKSNGVELILYNLI